MAMQTRNILHILFFSIFFSWACTNSDEDKAEEIETLIINTKLSDTKKALNYFSGCKRNQKRLAYNRYICISDDFFITTYSSFATMAPIKDSQEQRIKFLQKLIERQSVAYWATENNLDNSMRVKQLFTGHLRTQLSKQWIKDEIELITKKPTESDVREAFYRKNTRILLHQIYAKTREEIITYQKYLNNGENFYKFAKESMKIVGLDSTTYNMGWVGWQDLGLGPESTAYALEINEISKPVASLNGWHIFKLINKEERFFADASTFENNRESLREAIYARSFEEHSTRWIDSLKREISLTINKKSLALFQERILSILPNSPSLILKHLSNIEALEADSVFSPKFKIAKLDSIAFTGEDFIIALPQIPEYLISQDIRQALEIGIIDFLLAQEAQKKGYLTHPKIFTLLNIARHNILHDQAMEYVAMQLYQEKLPEDWFLKTKNQLDIQTSDFKQEMIVDTALIDRVLPYFF